MARILLIVMLMVGGLGSVADAQAVPAASEARAAAVKDGWTVPAAADTEGNPLAINPNLMTSAARLYASKCRRCHGLQGRGDGPDAGRDRVDHRNLTVASRRAANPDGVVFYKIWNGRTNPKMPRFSSELSREQVWALVAYVQSLRSGRP